MLGAIVGDIVGSIYERKNIKTKDFPFFNEFCWFTDDTVMTIAIADGLMNGGKSEHFINSMKRFGKLYPKAGYGGSFIDWLRSEYSDPYYSWGNGSAMRVSPVGWIYNYIETTEKVAEISASVTHNHPEGIKGAQATAAAIHLARKNKPKAEIKKYISEKYGYNLNRTLNEIRPSYSFDVSCQGTVPEAIIAFLESNGFEDSIRNAISLGGDSDTLAAITGSIAEAAYEIPEDIKKKALTYLPKHLLAVIDLWFNFCPSTSFTTYEQRFSAEEQDNLDSILDECIDFFIEIKELPWKTTAPEVESEREPNVIYLSYPVYPTVLSKLFRAAYSYSNLNHDFSDLKVKDIDRMNKDELLSYICHLNNGERFCDGLIASHVENGSLLRILLKLKSLRLSNN